MPEHATTVKSRSTSFLHTAKKKAPPFFPPVTIQPKLTVSAADDPYEREADATADKVMRMTNESMAHAGPAPLVIQRKCAACEEEEKGGLQLKPVPGISIQRKCDACEHEEHDIQRKETAASAPVRVSSAVHQTLQSAGTPLDAGTRSFMETRFGYDFSRVQVHTNSLAGQSATDINARAYTHDKHIVFAEGQYQPHTQAGKQLLAHELAHVVQQGAARPGKIQRTMGDGHDLQSPELAGDQRLENCFDGDANSYVRYGSTGDAVSRVQSALQELGYSFDQYGIDGIFGQETYNAVVEYQADTELDTDGIVGPLTIGALDTDLTGDCVCPVDPDIDVQAKLAVPSLQRKDGKGNGKQRPARKCVKDCKKDPTPPAKPSKPPAKPSKPPAKPSKPPAKPPAKPPPAAACKNQDQVDALIKSNPRKYPATVVMEPHVIVKGDTLDKLAERTAKNNTVFVIGHYKTEIEKLNRTLKSNRIGNCVLLLRKWKDPDIGALSAKAPKAKALPADVKRAIAVIYAEQTATTSHAKKQQRYIWFSIRLRLTLGQHGPTLDDVLDKGGYFGKGTPLYKDALKDLNLTKTHTEPIIPGVINAQDAVLNNWRRSVPNDAGSFYFHWRPDSTPEGCYGRPAKSKADATEKKCAFRFAKKNGFGNVDPDEGWKTKLPGDTAAPKDRIGSMYIYPFK